MVSLGLILGWLCAEGVKPCSEANLLCYIGKKMVWVMVFPQIINRHKWRLIYLAFYLMINDRVMSELAWKSQNCFYLSWFLHLDGFLFLHIKFHKNMLKISGLT